MSGWDYNTLRDGVEHAVGNLQGEFLKSHGIEEITQVDTELNEELEHAIFRIADCIQAQLVKERNPIGTHYCEKDDMTFIMRDSYDEKGNLVKQAVIGWYYGEPDEKYTRVYSNDLIANYSSDDHYLRGGNRGKDSVVEEKETPKLKKIAPMSLSEVIAMVEDWLDFNTYNYAIYKIENNDDQYKISFKEFSPFDTVDCDTHFYVPYKKRCIINALGNDVVEIGRDAYDTDDDMMRWLDKFEMRWNYGGKN